MVKKDEAKAQVRDQNPTRGVTCSSSENDSNPNALIFSEKDDCEDWAEYLAEEARVKAWKLHT